MASEKKSFGRKTLTKLFTIAVSVGAAMVVGPLIADVGTWYPIVHDAENLRAQAFTETLKPFTGFIPYHLGLTKESGGLLEPFMTALIGPALGRLEAQAENVRRADLAQNNLTTPLEEFDPLSVDPFAAIPMG